MGISHMHGLVSGETIMLLEDHCHLERGRGGKATFQESTFLNPMSPSLIPGRSVPVAVPLGRGGLGKGPELSAPSQSS